MYARDGLDLEETGYDASTVSMSHFRLVRMIGPLPQSRPQSVIPRRLEEVVAIYSTDWKKRSARVGLGFI